MTRQSSYANRETLLLERLVDDPELRRTPAKTLKGFCLAYLPHHFPVDLSDLFDDMARALQDHDLKRVEMIGFLGCAGKAIYFRSAASAHTAHDVHRHDGGAQQHPAFERDEQRVFR